MFDTKTGADTEAEIKVDIEASLCSLRQLGIFSLSASARIPPEFSCMWNSIMLGQPSHTCSAHMLSIFMQNVCNFEKMYIKERWIFKLTYSSTSGYDRFFETIKPVYTCHAADSGVRQKKIIVLWHSDQGEVPAYQLLLPKAIKISEINRHLRGVQRRTIACQKTFSTRPHHRSELSQVRLAKTHYNS